MQLTLQNAQERDLADVLASYQQEFVMTDTSLVYLDGNSLGRLPYRTQERLKEVIHAEWGQQLIRGWNAGWFDAPERIGGQIAQLVGAQADEVIVAESTSVNLFKLVLATMKTNPQRHKIITDNLNFPSDLYVLQGVADLMPAPIDVVVVPSTDNIHGPVEEIIAAIDEQTAVITLSLVTFKSGYLYDMQRITEAAHAKGAKVLWDLSHAAGAVPIYLNQTNADMAVGCTYKYLNGGPGAPAFLYVRRDLQEQLPNPISGWMGQKNLFEFGLNYQPAQGMRRYLTGTYPILSLLAIEPSVDLLLSAGIEALRAKSIAQTEYLIALWEKRLQPLGFTLNSPRQAEQRGSHVSLGHPEGLRIDLSLIHEMNILPDFRAPDNIRLGIAPLYTRFEEIWQTVEALHTIVTERRYEAYDSEGIVVT